jgi:hypothetical protein
MVMDFLVNKFPLLRWQEERLSQGLDLAVAREKEMLTKLVGR